MDLRMQDNLVTVDRSGGAAMAAVRKAEQSPKKGAAPSNWRTRVGETFAQALNRSMVKGEAAEGASPAAGGGYAALMNRQVAVSGAEAEGPQAGETAASYLNRKHVVAGVNAKTVSSPAAAPAVKTGWHRAATTTAEKLNQSVDVDAAAEAHAKAEKAAAGLVSNALILPILKQVRRSSFGENSIFSGGNGEKAFGPEFDMQLADRIAQSPRLGVREALVKRLEKRSPTTAVNNGMKVASRIDVNG